MTEPTRAGGYSVFQNMDRASEILEEELERSGVTPMPFLDRRSAEKQMLSIICLGNPHLLEVFLQENLATRGNISIGIMSKEELLQKRYLCIVVIALICRAVIDAGVPEHIAYAISDSLIQQADRLQRPDQFTELSAHAMKRYCIAVRDLSLGVASPPVRKCCEYMLLKIHTTITMEELSRQCRLSPNYVSDLFRKELGISAMQFFHRHKLIYAKHLIEHTDWSIAHISAYLSYPSQSNFTERFKKHYGTTPKQFRTQSRQ